MHILIDMADAVLFILAVINIIGLYLLTPVVMRELNSLLEFVRARNTGETTDGDEDQESVKTPPSAPGCPAPRTLPCTPCALVSTGPCLCRLHRRISALPLGDER